MKLNFKNIWKAGTSTFLGLISGSMVTLTTALTEGKFDMKALYVGLAIAGFMAMSDIFKEVKKEIDEDKP